MTTPQRRVTIGNTTQTVDSPNGSSYLWELYVVESDRAPVPLEAVVYSLHPTFTPNRIQVARGESTHFGLRRQGWGTFTIGVELHWADGQVDNTTHELEFQSRVESDHVFTDLKAVREAMLQQQQAPPAPANAATQLPPPPPSTTVAAALTEPVLEPAAAKLWHGYRAAEEFGACNWHEPTCIVRSDQYARPDYTKITSAEFEDTPEVLSEKADALIKIWLAAEHPVVYAGAGISTSSGIRDYASNARGSAVQPKDQRLTMGFIHGLKPTPAHRVLTAMEKKGLVWGWLQQNHDGLAQKAGFPAHKVNELHGSWLDQEANPIIAMSGNLRGDLFQWLVDMEKSVDFTFAVGTSLSGLNADRLAKTAASRHMKKGRGQGLAIISLQKTPYDDVCGLRIFSKIDKFMLIVAERLALKLDSHVHPYVPAALPVGPMREADWKKERDSRRKQIELPDAF